MGKLLVVLSATTWACASRAALERVSPRLIRMTDPGVSLLEGARQVERSERIWTCLRWRDRAASLSAIATSAAGLEALCRRYPLHRGRCPDVDMNRAVVLALVPQLETCQRLVALELASDGRLFPVTDPGPRADCPSMVCEDCAWVVVVPRALLPRAFSLFVAGRERRAVLR